MGASLTFGLFPTSRSVDGRFANMPPGSRIVFQKIETDPLTGARTQVIQWAGPDGVIQVQRIPLRVSKRKVLRRVKGPGPVGIEIAPEEILTADIPLGRPGGEGIIGIAGDVEFSGTAPGSPTPGRDLVDRRSIPRPDRDVRDVSAGQGERRTGGPMDSLLHELKAFFISPAGVTVFALLFVILILAAMAGKKKQSEETV